MLTGGWFPTGRGILEPIFVLMGLSPQFICIESLSTALIFYFKKAEKVFFVCNNNVFFIVERDRLGCIPLPDTLSDRDAKKLPSFFQNSTRPLDCKERRGIFPPREIETERRVETCEGAENVV